jgi:hypothetical protein
VHLFISNSKGTAITFVYFLSLFFAYNIFIFLVKPTSNYFQNQGQNNYVAAQDFIYNDKAPNIIVGSSMAFRMIDSVLPSDYFNLSFAGGSVLTGLEIIKKSEFIPSTIYIETNIIFRSKDEKIIENLFKPLYWKLIKLLPALQERYQPLNIPVSKIITAFRKSKNDQMNEIRNEKIFDMNIRRQISIYQKPIANYKDELSDLTKLIAFFEKSGTKIVFFEMPIESILRGGPRAKGQREVVLKNFNNIWLPLPPKDAYATSDGIHLMYESAYKYTLKFRENSLSLHQSPNP